MARDFGVIPTKSSPFYFISYNSEDGDRVGEYVRALSAAGLPIWYDNGIQVGDVWKRTIAQKIKSSDKIIVFMTKGVFKKLESGVVSEIEVARINKKKMIIVLLDSDLFDIAADNDCDYLWVELTRMQCIDAKRHSDLAECVRSIIAATGYSADGAVMQEIMATAAEQSAVQPILEPVLAPKVEIKTVNFSDGSVYTGEMLADKRHGKGKYIFSDGRVYDGEYVDGIKCGYGVFTWPNGDSYSGEFYNDSIHGKGKYCYSSGSVYEGEFIEGKKNGFGKFVWQNGNSYEGEYKNDQRHGKGKFTWPGGTVYDGEFKDDKRTGYGVITYECGDSYKGDFVDGYMHGKGKYISNSGAVFEGEWEKDKWKGWQ